MEPSKYAAIARAVLAVALAVALACDGSDGGGGQATTTSGLGVLHAAALRSAVNTWCGDAAEDPGLRFLPLSEDLQILPPLGVSEQDRPDFDRSLIDFLTVSICQVDGAATCVAVDDFTSGSSNGGHGEIRLEGAQYHLNWKMPEVYGETEYEIHFLVADLEMGYVAFASKAPQTLPIKFRIADNPLVRAAVLKALGVPVTQMAEELVGEFDLSAMETVWVLRFLDYALEDLHLVLTEAFGITDVFELESIFASLCIPPEEYLEITALESIQRFAPVLRFDRAYWGLPMSAQRWFDEMLCSGQIPYDPVFGVYDYLACSQRVMEYDFLVYCLDDITRNLCEIPRYVWGNPPPAGAGPGSDIPQGRPPVTALVDTESFCDPRSPEGYCCQWEIFQGGWACDENTTWGTQGPQGGPDVPTYYTVMSNPSNGALRIVYWWYYGYQPPCNWTGVLGAVGAETGEHVGDWERVMRTTTPDRSAVEAVTYHQHGGWYTRWASLYGFELVGERPVVYVGRTSHGSYHNPRDACGAAAGDGSMTCCCYWRDPRDPPRLADGSAHPGWEWDTSIHLVSMRGDEDWMEFDRGPPPSGNPFLDWRWGPSVGICGEGAGGACLDKKWETAISGHPTRFAPLNDIRADLRPPNEQNWCVTLCRGTDETCDTSGTNQQGCSGHNQDPARLLLGEWDRWGSWCDSYASGNLFCLQDIDW